MPLKYNASLYFSFIVFVALVFVRLYWLFYALEEPHYLFNGIPIINSNDGYYYAQGARDRLLSLEHNGLSPINAPLSILTAFLASWLPFEFSWIILFMPAVFGSFIAFPLYAILHKIILQNQQSSYYAAFGAFFGGIVVSYYNRTMMGYYDTDMLILVLVLCFYYFLFCLFEYNANNTFIKVVYSFFLIFFGVLSSWWHNGLQNLFLAIFGLQILYVLFIYFKHYSEYSLKKSLEIALLMSVLIMPSHLVIQSLLALIVLLIIFKDLSIYFLKIVLAFIVLISFFLGSFDLLIYQYQAYFLKNIPHQSSFIFYDVMQSIKEVDGISFNEFAIRVSSHIIIFFLSIIGFFMLVYKKPIMLLTLPFLVLGFAGMKIGLRFNIFAAPFLALSLAYFIFIIIQKYCPKIYRLWLCFVLFFVFCIPSVLHIFHYKAPPTFYRQEVEIITQLNHIADPKDYLVTWWDYGYGIRYYGNVKTLIDGGKHSGAINYPVSYMLSTPILSASAILSRMMVEIIEQDNDMHNNMILEKILEYYHIKSPNNFLLSLNNGILQAPPKTREIFFYIPIRMFYIFNTIQKFSNIDLQNGSALREGLFYASSSVIAQGDIIRTYNTQEPIIVDTQKGSISLNASEGISIKEFYIITEEYQQNPLIQTIPKISKKTFDAQSTLYVIYFKAQNMLVIADEYIFYSTALQLFAFANNENFTLVASNPLARIFKVSHY